MRLKQFLLEEEQSPTHVLMTKFLKGSTGILNAKNLETMFKELPGWKIEPAVLVSSAGRISNEEAKSLGIGPGSKVYQSGLSTEEKAEFHSEDKEALAAVREELLKQEVKSLPSKLKPKTYYYTNVSPIKSKKTAFSGIHHFFTVEPHFAGKGYVITGPGKLRYEEKLEAGYKGLTWWDLMKWAKAEGKKLSDDMIAVVGDPTIKKKRPTVEGVTGECQVCEGIQKLNKGKLVLHGYKRPGYGYTVGNCYGYGYVPYSESADRCKDYKMMMEHLRKDRKKSISEFKTGKIKSLEIEVHKGYGKPKERLTIKPGHDLWEDTVKRNIMRLEADIKAIDGEIERMEKRIKNWKPKG